MLDSLTEYKGNVWLNGLIRRLIVFDDATD